MVGTVAIVQARMGSTRLPGKVLRPIKGHPMLWHIVRRVRWAPGIDDVVVATSDLPGDEPIRRFCRQQGIRVFSGSERDVLDRFYQAAIARDADPVLRITGDCPFVDPEIVGQLVSLYAEGTYDHVGVATGADAIFLARGRFPDGLDAECFSFAALARAWREAAHPLDREHVTPYIWRNKETFRCGLLTSAVDYAHLRWTVDNEVDFRLVTAVYDALYREDRPFLTPEILAFLDRNAELADSNRDLVGGEGYREIWQVDQPPGPPGKKGEGQ